MACNCNTASKNCDPCAFCTPPGVTGLTTCHPIDPCEEKPDIDCVFYNGPDADCIGIKNGDNLLSVLLTLLQSYFPPNYCCALGGTANWSDCYLTGYAIWANPAITTTTTAAVTTSTTQAPLCSFYEISNSGSALPGALIEYVSCNCLSTTQILITNNPVTVCVNNAFPINVLSGSINPLVNSGPCSLHPCPTTTTTINVPCTCNIYTVTNNTTQSVTITYTACNPTGNVLISNIFAPGSVSQVCACSDIQQTIQGVTIVSQQVVCTAPPTTSTTTVDCVNTGGTVTILESFIMVANLVTKIAFHIINSTKAFWIDWGDGTITNYPAGSYYHLISHTYTGSYSGNVTFYSTDLTGFKSFYDADYSSNPLRYQWPAFNCLPGGSLSVTATELHKLDGCTAFEFLNTKVTGDVNDLPKSLQRVIIWGNGSSTNSADCSNTIYGDIANIPPLAKAVAFYGKNTLTGNIATLPVPPSISSGYFLGLRGDNTVWGDIKFLPSGVVSPATASVNIWGYNTITGDIATIPQEYVYIDFRGGDDQIHTDAYGNTVWGNLCNINPNVINFNVRGENTLTGNLSCINSVKLKEFYVRGRSSIFGNINSISAPNLEVLTVIDDLSLTNISGSMSSLSTLFPNLKNLQMVGPHALTGSLTGLPTTLQYFKVFAGPSNLTGIFNNLNPISGLIQWIYFSNACNISGDLKDIPSSLKLFSFKTLQTGLVVTYTPPHSWANPMQAVDAVTGTAMSTTNINNLLVSLAAVPTWNIISGGSTNDITVSLKGVATGAGLTAITTLQTKGVTVTITP